MVGRRCCAASASWDFGGAGTPPYQVLAILLHALNLLTEKSERGAITRISLREVRADGLRTLACEHLFVMVDAIIPFATAVAASKRAI